jgi:hypothetical protein
VSERARKLSFLEKRARCRKENANVTPAYSLECLYPLTCDLGVRLSFAKSFTRRIESDGRRIDERLEIGEPALCSRHAFGYDDEKPTGTGVRERSDGERVAGAWDPGSVEPGIYRR